MANNDTAKKGDKQKEFPPKDEREKGRKLDVSALENWLWDAACTIRGLIDAPKYKDYILPLIFLKRLSDLFEDEIRHVAQECGDEKTAAKRVDQDHKLVRFYIPEAARWPTIANKATGLGKHLTDAVRMVTRENPRLSGVIDVTDFNTTTAGQRIVDDGRLGSLVQVLSNPNYRLGLGRYNAPPRFHRERRQPSAVRSGDGQSQVEPEVRRPNHKNDSHERFKRGTPPKISADWGWVQHMFATLNDRGRMAVVLDTGAVSRGSGNQVSNKERDVRKQFIEDDLVEAVILFKEKMFYNTTAPGIVLVLNRKKRKPGEILVINASKLFSKGRPKNFLEEEHIEHIAKVYHEWQAEEGLSAIITKEEAARNDYNLSPSRYVSTGAEAEVMPLDEAVVLLAEADEERAEADQQLDEVLVKLGFKGWRNG